MDSSAGLILGIDEAGRGAQIGPVVLAGVVVTPVALELLARCDLRDSKAISPKRRRALLETVLHHATWFATETRSARVVDRYVSGRHRRRPTTLNVLEQDLAVALIASAPPCSQIVADGRALFHPLESRFAALTAHNHADQTHPAVMAAALLAKAERDRLLDAIARSCPSLCGHIPRRGYPGPDTTEWLERYRRFFGEYPADLRLTWGQSSTRPKASGRVPPPAGPTLLRRPA
jgi:ribonuclease HII